MFNSTTGEHSPFVKVEKTTGDVNTNFSVNAEQQGLSAANAGYASEAVPACGHWQRGKPDRECYFVHRKNNKDNYPDLYEAKFEDDVLCVFNIQDDEFIYTMEEMMDDGEFVTIEK